MNGSEAVKTSVRNEARLTAIKPSQRPQLALVRKVEVDRSRDALLTDFGKTTLEDMRTLGQLVEEGLVVPPRYLPAPFADLNALSAWMCFSGFLNNLSLERVEADYANIL